MKTNAKTYKQGELWALLSQASNALSRVSDKELRPVGISMMQAAVLYFVKNSKEPVTPAALHRWLFREPHTVSQLLMRMETQGLVNRTKDLDKKNMVRITLTDKGEKAYQQQTKMRAIGKIMSSLSPEESSTFGACLKKLRDEAIKELDTRPRQMPFP
jgi:DNA-binding MarR family transcriptional regulator